MEESPICAARAHGEPRPAPPFKEVVGVVDEVHKHNLVRVEEGQAQRRIGRVVDVGQRHADEGGSGEVQFEVVEVVCGGVAGHLSAQSDCRVGGVGDRHGQGGSGRQVGRREVHAFGEGASRGEAEVDEFQAEVAVDAAGVGEVLFEGLVLVDDARQKILLEEDLRVFSADQMWLPSHPSTWWRACGPFGRW